MLDTLDRGFKSRTIYLQITACSLLFAVICRDLNHFQVIATNLCIVLSTSHERSVDFFKEYRDLNNVQAIETSLCIVLSKLHGRSLDF